MTAKFYSEEKLAIGAAIIFAAFGLIAEFIWLWPDFFSRSGALIVCVGIFFGYLEINTLYAKGFEGVISDLETKKDSIEMAASDAEIEEEASGTVAHARLKKRRREPLHMRRDLYLDRKKVAKSVSLAFMRQS